MKNLAQIPYTFVLMNWAAVVGLYYFLRGDQDMWKEIWTSKTLPPERSAPSIQGKDWPTEEITALPTRKAA